MKVSHRLHPVLWLALVALVAGCSGSSDPDYPLAGAALGSESAYSAGSRVDPVTYDEAASITLSLKNADGTYTRLANGDYVEAGRQTLAVKITGGLKGRGRVFVSNGGGLQTEALLEEDGTYYTCEWRFSRDSFRQVLLIQEIYADGSASKEKYVLATDPNPGSDQLVREGLGLMVGAEILEALKGPMGSLLEGMLGLSGVSVNELRPATRAGDGVIYLDLTIPVGAIPIDLNADLVLDDAGRMLNIDLENIALWNSELLGNIIGILNLFPIVNPPVALDLADLLGGMGGDEGEDDLLGSLLGGLEIEKYLFLDLYGRPGETTADFACLGSGLYVADKADAPTNAEGEPLFPEVSIFDLPQETPMFLPTPEAPYNLGVTLTQYNLNQILGSLLGGTPISFYDAGIFGELIIIIPANDGTKTQALKITFNPAGLAFDLRGTDMILMINDLRLEYVENGTPIWQMSVDTAFDLRILPGLDGPTLDLYLDILPEYTHTHSMRDNLGVLGLYDHSDFFMFIFETLASMLTDDPEGPLLSLNLAELLGEDLITFKEGTAPLSLSSGDGNCYLGLAVESLDVGSVGACFIETAR